MFHNLYDSVSAALTQNPTVKNATANGTGVDLKGYETAVAVVQFGTWTDGTHTPSLEESDDNSSFSAVAAADLEGAFTAVSAGGGSNTIQQVGYKGRKRYVRLSLRGATSFNTVFAQALVARGEANPDTASEAGEDVRVVG